MSTEKNEIPEITDNDISATEAVVADATLKSSMGWEVLNQMYLECAKKLQSTSGFTMPVISQMEVLKTKLEDPDAFQAMFRTLTADIQAYHARLQEAHAQHSGRSGEPDESEWPMLFTVSQEYSNLMDLFDVVIAPLIFSMIEIIQRDHGDMLEIPAQGAVDNG